MHLEFVIAKSRQFEFFSKEKVPALTVLAGRE